MCINILLKLFFFGSGPSPDLPETIPPPENHTYAQYFQQKWIDINV